MDLQKLVNAMSESGRQEINNYHATFGDLIDKLKNADESARLSPKIVGIGAYRGYYSDIALCTDSEGVTTYSSGDYDTMNWEKDRNSLDFPQNPKELAKVLESIVGRYFDGYNGGLNEITRDKPLWIATDYGDCSSSAVIEITDDLELITKEIE